MRLVMKFGGTAVDSGKKIVHIANLIKSYHDKGNEIIGVFSAVTGMTDEILNVSGYILKRDKKKIKDFINKTRAIHVDIIQNCIRNKNYKAKALQVVEVLLEEMENILNGIVLLAEVTEKAMDYLLSFGERLLTPIVSYSLLDKGLDSVYLTGKEAGILTDSKFGQARPLIDTTKIRVKYHIDPLLKENKIPVITGFIGADQNGNITTLGRSGSDYTATIIAVCIEADEVWLWTDVNGLMTADPQIVKEAKVLKEVSFAEAIELSLFGAKYMHPRALEPVMDTKIPIRIRNAFNLSNEGTIISKNPSKSSQIVKSIIAIQNTALIDVSGGGMVGAPGTAAKIFDALARKSVNIMMISQSPSESSISMVVKKDDLDTAITTLDLTLLDKVIKNVRVNEDVAVVAVVGSGMRGIKGIAAKVFSSVSKNSINVIMIAQGSSELNLAFVVNNVDCEKAVRSLHEAFMLTKVN
ncbi:MAG: aspartate kinase [Nitrosopumilales archaeon]|jgi:aspartate kinase|nr:MAG: aspartate kinase [Nitrosopumilales archaeon]